MGTDEGAAPQPNILAVDDTPANLSLLKERGYRVRPVPSGALALQAAAAERPSLILLDIGMPEMDGFEVCRRLKADARLKDVPVIFLSAHTDVADKLKAFAVGGVDYVTKPFQFEEVHARVAAHLEICRQRRALEESYQKLADLEKLRDSLVHMMVHDLRTPLSALCAFLDFLKEDAGPALSEDGRNDIEEATAAARKMVDMVSTILDVSKLEAGRLVPRLAAHDVGAIAADVAKSLGALTRDRTLWVEPRSAPAMALVDRELIARVLQNLLANALKFTPTGANISVRVESAGDVVHVEVKDSGPGIPADQLGRIFDKFGAVEARASGRRYSSTGLGLNFSKLAVEAHGGAIGVDSVEGKGSTFWFTVPRGPASEESRTVA